MDDNDENSWQEKNDGSAIAIKRWFDSKGHCRKSWLKGSDVIIYYDENRDLHRLLGPALIQGNTKHWYYHGELIDCQSQEEFEKKLKLKAFW